jgi:four helix bundle protein
MSIKSFRDLIAWQKAMDFAEEVYRLTSRFPHDERFGLTAQLRKASVSSPSNIAEGHGRHTTQEFLHFLSIAYGSLNEAQTQILLAERLAYLVPDDTAGLYTRAAEVGRLINGLCNSLQNRAHPDS